MVDFLGVAADRRLLEEGLHGLPDASSPPPSVPASRGHDRLVAAGSLLTAATLIGGGAMAIYGGEQLLFGAGGLLAVALCVIGILFVVTHWGWVHVAEYVGLGIDQRQERHNRDRRAAWLETVAPYPRFTVLTSVTADASTCVERVSYTPVLTAQHTFTFARRSDIDTVFDADTPAAMIAARVETLRREARVETDRLRELWEAAAGAYDAALVRANDDHQELEARRAAAVALSQHINDSLLTPPLSE